MNSKDIYSWDHSASVTPTIRNIEAFLDQPLPGAPAQYKMAPPDRPRSLPHTSPGHSVVKAGILILLYPDKNRLCTVVIKRNTYPGPHSGQISFPGGKEESSDHSLADTAIRETSEEIGVHADKIRILGQLTPLFIPVSQIEVYPFAGYCPILPEWHPDPGEVKEIIPVDLQTLLKQPPGELSLGRKDESVIVPCYDIHPHKIWGATAMIMSEFLEVMRKTGTY